MENGRVVIKYRSRLAGVVPLNETHRYRCIIFLEGSISRGRDEARTRPP